MSSLQAMQGGPHRAMREELVVHRLSNSLVRQAHLEWRVTEGRSELEAVIRKHHGNSARVTQVTGPPASAVPAEQHNDLNA